MTIISDHNLLYGSIGGIELFKVCDLIDINTSLKDRHFYENGPENKYQGNFVPSSFYVEKTTSGLHLRLKVKSLIILPKHLIHRFSMMYLKTIPLLNL
ncbi:hypothetical protein Bccel_0462 [Pseudobacteroides cellulosolvens ATCC 35603 = DSM 2933]|uniref:Uncharacterized protein n=1 Tax=Pseudobacteroides cellulosolvens ATCC 35603 = DSM 2933 TaxID=398512 RepID=A0A0L6JHN3_9FIRM|nr:hypothetical protein [Pseudobacteroides cellulosolvens]KNY25205.1 hypothetical protein Bccel_0462 [Pseudobacteroides cellulosolvens ATCC 35603 = DSM 2933]